MCASDGTDCEPDRVIMSISSNTYPKSYTQLGTVNMIALALSALSGSLTTLALEHMAKGTIGVLIVLAVLIFCGVMPWGRHA